MLKDVKGFEGNYTVNENGDVFSTRSGEKLAPVQVGGKYWYVHLCNGKKHTKLVRIHRVVAEAFLERKIGCDQVNHINGDKSDNRVANLEWCTGLQNMAHAIEKGLFRTSGENNPSAKLTCDQVEEIRKIYRRGDAVYGTRGLGKKYGVSNVMISKIVRNKNWANLERSLHRAEGDV